MIPTQALFQQIMALLAADPTTLAPVLNPNKIALVMAPFVPSQSTTLASLTLANFDGSAPIAGMAGAQGTGSVPTTGDQRIDILEPAGGFRWKVTGPTNLPQTIYGYALVDNAGATLFGTNLLPAPVTLTAAGQVLDVDDPSFTLLNAAVV